MTVSKLQPVFSTDMKAQTWQCGQQKIYYNQHVKASKHIQRGQTIRIRLPGQSTWSTGVCMGLARPRSYEVQVGSTAYRRYQ